MSIIVREAAGCLWCSSFCQSELLCAIAITSIAVRARVVAGSGCSHCWIGHCRCYLLCPGCVRLCHGRPSACWSGGCWPIRAAGCAAAGTCAVLSVWPCGSCPGWSRTPQSPCLLMTGSLSIVPVVGYQVVRWSSAPAWSPARAAATASAPSYSLSHLWSCYPTLTTPHTRTRRHHIPWISIPSLARWLCPAGCTTFTFPACAFVACDISPGSTMFWCISAIAYPTAIHPIHIHRIMHPPVGWPCPPCCCAFSLCPTLRPTRTGCVASPDRTCSLSCPAVLSCLSSVRTLISPPPVSCTCALAPWATPPSPCTYSWTTLFGPTTLLLLSPSHSAPTSMLWCSAPSLMPKPAALHWSLMYFPVRSAMTHITIFRGCVRWMDSCMTTSVLWLIIWLNFYGLRLLCCRRFIPLPTWGYYLLYTYDLRLNLYLISLHACLVSISVHDHCRYWWAFIVPSICSLSIYVLIWFQLRHTIIWIPISASIPGVQSLNSFPLSSAGKHCWYSLHACWCLCLAPWSSPIG